MMDYLLEPDKACCYDSSLKSDAEVFVMLVSWLGFSDKI